MHETHTKSRNKKKPNKKHEDEVKVQIKYMWSVMISIAYNTNKFVNESKWLFNSKKKIMFVNHSFTLYGDKIRINLKYL